MKTLREKIAELPPEEQREIERGTAQLLREYDALQELREALGITQCELADRLESTQGQVSRIEKRDDIKISTLLKYIDALGCELVLSVKLPEGSKRKTVELKSFTT